MSILFSNLCDWMVGFLFLTGVRLAVLQGKSYLGTRGSFCREGSQRENFRVNAWPYSLSLIFLCLLWPRLLPVIFELTSLVIAYGIIPLYVLLDVSFVV